MDKDAFLEFIKEIGTTEDITEVRTKLTELSDQVVEVFDSNATLTEQNNTYKDDNEKLRSANMQLFLRVGADKTEKEVEKNKTGVDEEENQPRKFEDLFDEKGGLK